jgi:hypothetical protein
LRLFGEKTILPAQKTAFGDEGGVRTLKWARRGKKRGRRTSERARRSCHFGLPTREKGVYFGGGAGANDDGLARNETVENKNFRKK